ncbi:hypothetical protein PT309_03690, partial [Metamycoplasma hyosynoviae]
MKKELKDILEKAKIVISDEKKQKKMFWYIFIVFISIFFFTLCTICLSIIEWDKSNKILRIIITTIFYLILVAPCNIFFILKVVFLWKIIINKDINDYKISKYMIGYFLLKFNFSYAKEIKIEWRKSKINLLLKDEEFKKFSSFFDNYDLTNIELIFSEFKSEHLLINKYNIFYFLLKNYLKTNEKYIDMLNAFVCLNFLNKLKVKNVFQRFNFKLNENIITSYKKEYIFTFFKLNKIFDFERKQKQNHDKKIARMNIINMISSLINFYFVFAYSIFLSTSFVASYDNLNHFGFSKLSIFYIWLYLMWTFFTIIIVILFVFVLKYMKLKKSEKIIFIFSGLIVLIQNFLMCIFHELGFYLKNKNWSNLYIGLVFLFLNIIVYS